MFTQAPSTKPFSPEDAQRIVGSLQQPAVFLDMTCDWPALNWTAEHLSRCLGDKSICFRLGRKDESNTPLFETRCSYVEASLGQFLSWASGQSVEDGGPFSEYPHSHYWAYADYKHIAMLFQDQPSLFEDVLWSEFGFPGRNGKESTLWIGTQGANTPCHQDTYGYNLVLQVQGRKCWHLFPPEDVAQLYPTRIPYEESSVFSQVDVLRPDLWRFPGFSKARAHIVTLEPGQVLYVPRHWWHFVESVDPITVSVNSWIELELDDKARVGEAVTRAVVCALKTTPSKDNTDDWLNPTEEGVGSLDENMEYVNLAVQACIKQQRDQHHSEQPQGHREQPQSHREQPRSRGEQPQSDGEQRPRKRDSTGQAKNCTDSSHKLAFYNVPFGPHLIPVSCDHTHQQKSSKTTPKDFEIESQRDCLVGFEAGRVVRSTTDCEVSPDTTHSSGPVHHGSPQHLTYECKNSSDQSIASPSRDITSGHSAVSGDAEDMGHTPITTNDLLECLVHPDVVTRVTELLLRRQRRPHPAPPTS